MRPAGREVALAIGALAFILLVVTVRRLRAGKGGHALDRMPVATATGLALPVASGTVRGEVGRIWIPLLPLLLVASLAGDEPDGPAVREALVLGTLLAALGLTLRAFWILP